jgi:hypothetical protein
LDAYYASKSTNTQIRRDSRPTDDEIMLDKLRPLLSILYTHIEGGIAKARSFFETEEEPPDPWLLSHIVRWYVCKRLDSLKDPNLSYERSPLAMSGIGITYDDRYVKVFKASDGELPAAGRSHPRQEFYKGKLFEQDEWGLPTYLAVIWDVNGSYHLLDIQLVCPDDGPAWESGQQKWAKTIPHPVESTPAQPTNVNTDATELEEIRRAEDAEELDISDEETGTEER